MHTYIALAKLDVNMHVACPLLVLIYTFWRICSHEIRITTKMYHVHKHSLTRCVNLLSQ